ncbi:MAG: hypothetical protein Fur0037_24070 [Planctomycetota bacterium]
MNWIPWFLPFLLLAFALVALLRRRIELAGYAKSLSERSHARSRGSHKARLQYPDIDLSRCIGCGACTRACPEDGVLALAYGQAVVVHGARCVGHGLCAAACPTQAIALTLGDLGDRRDLPAVDEKLEAIGVPGLFLAGELTGFALVRTAIQHGQDVAREIARRLAAVPEGARRPEKALVAVGPAGLEAEETAGGQTEDGRVRDVLILGMGPAGFSCALACEELGIDYLAVEQQAMIGGTVAAYPRRKLVLTQPVDLPLHGRLSRLSYLKEELVELWERLCEKHRLKVRLGAAVKAVHRGEAGIFSVETNCGEFRARHVVMALGRRGTPRKLGVPGEDLPKVSYSLLDAEGYEDRRIIVVGGGDSAVEAAMALAEQRGNRVVLSYRKAEFSRIKARNEKRLSEFRASNRLEVVLESDVVAIHEDSVELQRVRDGQKVVERIPNDEVFVFAGGLPPFPLLEAAGVSFDPADRPPETRPVDRGTGLLVALGLTTLAALGLLAAAILRSDYYGLALADRVESPWHPLLRPRGLVGLSAGVLAALLFLANLAYLARRSPRFGRLLPGSLRSWMNAHIFTGLLAFLAVCLHCGFKLRDSVGGHSFLALSIVVTTGVIGRYIYSFVPRRQNGRQADLEELESQVCALSSEWDAIGRGFGAKLRSQIERAIAAEKWKHGLLSRIASLVRSQIRLNRDLRELRAMGRKEGIPSAEVARLIALARRAHRLALQLSHFEEVRGVLASWRWLHRWLALLMVLLTALHVLAAFRYGEIRWSSFWGGQP